MRRSLSLMTRFFSRPAISRSMASSKSFISTAVLSLRAASSAASLTRLARSAPAHIRLVDEHLSIETAGAEQRRVEHLGTVRRPHDDDPLAAIEPIHLGEQLIQRLFAFLVAAHRG